MNENQSLIIVGRNAVLESLNSNQAINALYISNDCKGAGEYITKAKSRGIVIKQVAPAKLDELAQQSGNIRHSGVAAVLSAVEYVSTEEILASSRTPFILLCDGIEDPHNLGALIRTAEAAGVTGVIIPKRRGVAVTAAVYTASAGAAAHMKIARVTNLVDAMNTLKKNGVWIYGAETDGEDCNRIKFNAGEPRALVIGSEGGGLSRLVRETCDFVISVPMFGKINSLNASVCGGILMFSMTGMKGGDKI
jgi:23S rRNA (guanosine2251-2'-O)-methyltransferase